MTSDGFYHEGARPDGLFVLLSGAVLTTAPVSPQVHAPTAYSCSSRARCGCKRGGTRVGVTSSRRACLD